MQCKIQLLCRFQLWGIQAINVWLFSLCYIVRVHLSVCTYINLYWRWVDTRREYEQLKTSYKIEWQAMPNCIFINYSETEIHTHKAYLRIRTSYTHINSHHFFRFQYGLWKHSFSKQYRSRLTFLFFFQFQWIDQNCKVKYRKGTREEEKKFQEKNQRNFWYKRHQRRLILMNAERFLVCKNWGECECECEYDHKR